MKSILFLTAAMLLVFTFCAVKLNAAPFTAGNIVIYRVGDGAAALSNLGNAVFLDEYTQTGTLVQSIALPTTADGANRPLIASGTATTEGLLNLSANRQFLILTGYGRPLVGGVGSVSGTASTDVPRVIGRVDGLGLINTTTGITDAFSANSIRSATSSNGTDFFAVGGNNGVRYTILGATTTTQINTGLNAATNLRAIGIFGNQLFYSSGAGANPRIVSVGTGVPTTTGQDSTPLAGVSAAASAYQFYFADLSPTVAGVDTLYYVDDTNATGGIFKYSLVGGVWTANGSLTGTPVTYRGLTGFTITSGGVGRGVKLFAVRGGNELVAVADLSGYNAAITGTQLSLATAATNTAFRGAALTPLSPNAATGSIGGRVVMQKDRGIYGARIQVTDSTTNQTYTAQTTADGSFNFKNLPVGNTYVISVYHKRYTFENRQQVLQLNESREDVLFVADGR